MPAGLWLRFQAFAADYLLIFGYLLLVMVVSLFLIPSLQELFQASPGKAQLTGFLLVTLPVSLYFVVTDSRLGGNRWANAKSIFKWLMKTTKRFPFPVLSCGLH